MDFNESIRAIAKSRGYTLTALAEEVGVKFGTLTNVLKRNNPTVESACKYVGAMGYDVVLMPKGSRLPEGAYVLEPNREEA